MNTMLEGGLLMMLTLPLLIAVLLATDIIAGCRAGAPTLCSGRTPEHNGSQSTRFSSRSCSACHRPMQAGWQVCPYDGTEAQ